jgi:hypothetical protein
MRLPASPEGLTRPLSEVEVCQGGRALLCLRYRGRARQRLFPEPRVVNTYVPFTSFDWVSLILIPDNLVLSPTVLYASLSCHLNLFSHHIPKLDESLLYLCLWPKSLGIAIQRGRDQIEEVF